MNKISENKVCQNCKQDFTVEPYDFAFYEKMGVPAPTWCPMCRQKRRLFFRNFRTLYKRKSSKSGASILSMYNEDVPFPVWSRDEWYADDWDSIEFGQEFDFSRPFFEQYLELSNKVPRFSLMVNNSPGCTYANLCNRSKNCYFVFGCVDNEDCDYGHSIWNCKESIDCLYLFKSEYCYECTDVLESSRLFFSKECTGCVDSIGLYDCRGCTNCIGCVGLRNQSYRIFNQPVTKEAYQDFITKYPLSNPKNIEFILAERDKLLMSVPMPHMFGSRNTNVTGNHIYNAKNIKFGFDIKGGEDSKFGFTVRKMVNSYDINFSLEVENCYESLFSNSFGIRFCHLVLDSTEAYYSEFCLNTNNIFGCIGLRKKDYCILNKQYTKEEYENLLQRIIEHMKQTGEWGQFFPITLSPFAYNESTIGEYYPLSKSEALEAGYVWQDDIAVTVGQENLDIGSLPESEMYYFPTLKDKIFACEECRRNYRFIEHEVSFYERFNLALPRRCYFCRHDKRMMERLPRALYSRKCMCSKNHTNHSGECTVDIETSYASERPETVYCEKCYQQEVY